ncbi:MAG TPA: ATP synthase F0 subunit B [Verrucomicrobiae bacterium]|jgi:F-type H+-transporting ATPase subunit b|nr:ATP synthase F0 subunit B [Verrucomicrobiae bacterium]
MLSKRTKSVAPAALAVLLASLVGLFFNLPIQAQQQPPAPDQIQSAEEPARMGPGRQLVHESREAAGQEKDEMDEFKTSASVRLISRISGLDLKGAYWLSLLTNFGVIVIVFVWAGRKYLPGMFRDRTAAIQKAMQEAQKASEEARQKLAEIEARLQKLDVEIGAIRDAAEKEAAAEVARIEAAAREDAHKIIVAAEQEIGAAAKAARRQLTAHAADLAVGLAKKQIRVDAGTDQNLVRNFASQLTASADGISSNGSGKDGN